MRKAIGEMEFAAVYPMYVRKVEKKDRSAQQLDEAIRWLTGYSQAALDAHKTGETTFEEFFGAAPKLNPDRDKVTGMICGVRVEDIDDPLMQQVRQLDKLVDEIARGRPMEKVLCRD